MKTGTSAEAVTSAVAVREALGDRLHSFEVGNETDLMPQFNGKMAEYLATYRAYKAAIRAVLPEAPFAGPDAALGTRWVEQFAREEPEAVVLTRHYYRGGAKDPASTIERLRQPDARWLHQVEVLREISAKAKVPFRINEINSLFGGGKKGVSDTFAATLWCLDTLLLLAANGCDGVNLQTDINHLAWVSEYSPIYRYPDDRLEARPAYYGLLAFAVAGIGDVLACTTDQAPEGVRVLAVRSADGDVWVTALSQDPSAQVQLSIRLPPSLGTARCLRLVAPALDRTDQVTLGGSAVAPDGTWSPAQTEELAVQDGVASVNLPGASAALVRLGH